MPRHKQQKALRRAKQKRKGIKMHKGSWASKYPDRDHPKPLSPQEVFVLRRPVERPDEPVDSDESEE